jgi:streptogramin lyase
METMKAKTLSVVLTFTAALAWQAPAQTYDTNNEVVQTFAGYGIPGYVDGQGQLTAFSAPSQIVADTASNLYVWDSGNARIRKITPTGAVTTFAGGGSSFDGYGTNVSLAWGSSGALVIDHANTLWLVLAPDSYSGSTYLLTIGTNGYVSIANGGLTNLGTGSGLCFDSANNLYYSGGNRIYRYNPATGVVQAIAGSGIAGNFDGTGTQFSAFNYPGALACDQADNLYVWDAGNSTIRRVDPSQNVTTVAGSSGYYYNSTADGVGTNATFSSIDTMFFDNQGNLYLVCGSSVRRMNAQASVVTLAGSFDQNSFANGPGYLARFDGAAGGCLSQGMIFVADAGNNRIRNIAFNPQSQVVSPSSLQLNTYPGLQISGTVGRTYQIQSSPDMNSWNPLATVLLTTSPYLWIDQNPVSGNKFYRALMLP